jgi:histidyl-tRNA synthetase
VFDPEHLRHSVETAASLRAAGVTCELYLGEDKLGHQIRYASRKNVPLVVIIGPDEASQGKAILRNMANGEQRQTDRGALLGAIQAEMSLLGGIVQTT